MNIAILIGISKYTSESALPACALDVDNLFQLLNATKKYDDIQCIKDRTDAAHVKDQLRAFFKKHQASRPISEAFIYFSGHGIYNNDALLCCSDFDANRPATTSIGNSELDDLLRSVGPDVAVKVIDACQSGSPYIKDASAGFEKALGASKLDSFICMASSRLDQSSYASALESEFTSKWIAAALSKQDGAVYYRDILAFLADAFSASSNQTPYFVNQGTGLEIFADVNEDMRALGVRRTQSKEPDKGEPEIQDAIEFAVSKLDEQFVPHEKAQNAIEAARSSLVSRVIQDPVVKRFYTKNVVTDVKWPSIPKVSAVAAFADEQGWNKKFFVKIKREEYQVRVPRDPLERLLGARSYLSKRDDTDYVTETRTRPSSIEPTEALPFEIAEILYSSAHPSVAAFRLYLGIVHSLTELTVISSTIRLTQKGWSERAPELPDVQWRFANYSWVAIVNDPETVWSDALAKGEADIRAYLEALVPKKDVPVEGADGAQSPSATT